MDPSKSSFHVWYGIHKQGLFDIHDVAKIVGLPKPVVYGCLQKYAKGRVSVIGYSKEDVERIKAYYSARDAYHAAIKDLQLLFSEKT